VSNGTEVMSSKVTESIYKQASEWFVLMQSNAVTESERSEFLQWLHKCSEHQEAFHEYEQIWRDLGELATTKEGARLRASTDSFFAGNFSRYVQAWIFAASTFFGKLSRDNALDGGDAAIGWSRAGRFALAGCVIFISVLLFNNFPGVNIDIQSYQTGIAQIRDIQLPDGTHVTLSGKSQMTAWNTGSERHVELLKGQAFFEVAKNPEKPFYVKTGDTLIRVVGTKFDVNRTSSRVSIAVLEGIVKVSNILDHTKAVTEIQSVTVTGGLQISRDAGGGFSPVEKVASTNVANWRDGRLVYSNARLCDVIDDVNRYSQNQIHLDEALHNIKVTIAFDIGQVDSLPMLLSKMLPIAYTLDASGKVFIRPSPK
jgi:transmembrane sensor